MLGDHRNDVMAARGAGIPAFSPCGGMDRLMADGSGAVAHDMVEAGAIANRLLPVNGRS